MNEQRFGLPEEISVHTEDGSTGHVAAVYLTPDGPAPVARVVWDDGQFESLVQAPLGVLGVGHLLLDLTTADRDAADLIADGKVEQFVHEALAHDEATNFLRPIRKIRPTAPNPKPLPPIKIIPVGVVSTPDPA